MINYKQIYCLVKKIFDETGFFNYSAWDETYYTLRVYETAKKIIDLVEEKVDEELILVSALLHDIGKSKINFDNIKEDWHAHGRYGVELVKEILVSLSFSKEFIEKVCHLVEFHDERDLKEKSLELKILQDADLIADSGYAGFIRPFLFAGKNKRSIIETINYLNNATNRADEDHLLNLDVSKKLASEQIAIEKKMIKEISQTINSDLL